MADRFPTAAALAADATPADVHRGAEEALAEAEADLLVARRDAARSHDVAVAAARRVELLVRRVSRLAAVAAELVDLGLAPAPAPPAGDPPT